MGKIRDLNPYRNKVAGINEVTYLEFKNLLINAVKIESTTGDNISFPVETFVKNSLIENGCVGYDKLTGKWSYVFGEGRDELGNPTDLTFRFANGVTYRRPASYDNVIDGAYIVDALPITFALSLMIRQTTDFMTNCDVAINQNIDAIKTPFIVVAKDADLQLSIKHAIQQKQNGEPVVITNMDVGEALKSVDISVNYVADKIELIKSQYRDKLLNKLGIMSANTEKRERVQVGEVNATVGQCTDYIYLLIDTFNKQCETYGLPYKMSLNASLEDLYGSQNDIMSDTGNDDNEVRNNDIFA